MIKVFIAVFLCLILSVSSQCNTITNCTECAANSNCTICVAPALDFAFVGCTDNTTLTCESSGFTSVAECPVDCTAFALASDCAGCEAEPTCEPCGVRNAPPRFAACYHNCSAIGATIYSFNGTCPNKCAAPATQAQLDTAPAVPLCTLPSTSAALPNEFDSPFGCLGFLNIFPNMTETSNITAEDCANRTVPDGCNDTGKFFTEACINSYNDFLCASVCGGCVEAELSYNLTDNMIIGRPCQSYCDAINTACGCVPGVVECSSSPACSSQGSYNVAYNAIRGPDPCAQFAPSPGAPAPGSAPGAAPAPGVAPGSAPGSVPGAAPGAAPGSAPGAAPGSAPGAAPGSAPGAAPGSAPGAAPSSAGSIIASLLVTLIAFLL